SVLLRHAGIFQRPGAGLGLVLDVFDRMSERVVAAGDQANDQLRWRVERRRTLRCVEDTEPAGGAGSDIDEATAPLDALDDAIDRAGDRGNLTGDSRRDARVLRVDDPEHFFGADRIDRFGPRIP